MEVANWVKGVFFTMMCAVIMTGCYFLLLNYNNGNQDGALWYATRQIEHPIAKYYYSYCFLPNTHMEDGVDKALGGILYADNTNIMETESDLSTDTSDNCSFSSSSSHYSTGWK